METHDVGTVDAETGLVVGRDKLDDDYDHCILAPTNGRQSARHCRSAESHKRRGQGLRDAPNAVKLATRGAVVAILVPTFMPTTKAMLWMLKICWMVVKPHQVAIHRCLQLTDSFALCSYWIVSYEHIPTPICVLMIKYSVVCSPVSANLKCLPRRRQ
ncbi:hypothetical protein Cgig2_001654 [Carnegiea gigantea]|uniref:Uncharacterized protein n=1 Tax=Carnegiea gigantea TaxID=171969 RepID=A0A9Q1Q5D5_9CARY|nr:hypothetical protein Cgig2_001654 [Carnegiea gigantea]